MPRGAVPVGTGDTPRFPMQSWPDPDGRAGFAGTARTPHRAGLDDVTLVWDTELGRIGVLWQAETTRPHARAQVAGELDLEVLVRVDRDFGPHGPGLTAYHHGLGGRVYSLPWPELARVLGQPVPYWPYLLRDPNMIAEWRPGAAAVIATARPDLDTDSLLRVAAGFDVGHPTARTLRHLARVDQQRSAEDARSDLRHVSERAAWLAASGVDPGITAAAEPLVVDDADAALDEPDPTTRRIGWKELLARTDAASWQCVRQALRWDGGKYFAFVHPVRIDITSEYGREWATRLHPAIERTASFACIDDPPRGGSPMADPLTDAPAILLDGGEAVAAVPQRLPAAHPLAEVILDRPIWIRTADGTLYPAPMDHYFGLNWGYRGSGPGSLALLIGRLLDNISAPAADHISGAAPGLDALTEIAWPQSTVLRRDVIEAARAGRPWGRPGASPTESSR